MIKLNKDHINENKIINQAELIIGKTTRMKYDLPECKEFKCLKAEEIKQVCINIKGLCDAIIEENDSLTKEV
jgi:hypothetical protein